MSEVSGRTTRSHSYDVQDSIQSLANMKLLIEACVAGLKQSNVAIKDLNERYAALDLAVKDGLGQQDLRVSAIETKQQILETSANDNITLNERVNFLSKSIIPTWRSEAEDRMQVLEETQKRIQTEITMLKAKMQFGHEMPATNGLTDVKSPEESLINISSTPAPEVGVTLAPQSEQPPVKVTSDDDSSQSAQKAEDRSATAIQADKEDHADVRDQQVVGNGIHANITHESQVHPVGLAEATDRLLSVPPDMHLQTLDECLGALAQVKVPVDVQHSQREIVTSTLESFDLNEPLVKREGFEHKRDWLAAWNAKVKQVQIDANDQIKVLRQDREALASREKALSEAASSLEDIIKKMRDVCIETKEDREDIASIRHLQADHEEELEKRLHSLMKREEELDRDEYFVSIRGKPASDLLAQDYRRKQKMNFHTEELRRRIKDVLNLEQQIMQNGLPPNGIAQYLPQMPEDPDIS